MINGKKCYKKKEGRVFKPGEYEKGIYVKKHLLYLFYTIQVICDKNVRTS